MAGSGDRGLFHRCGTAERPGLRRHRRGLRCHDADHDTDDQTRLGEGVDCLFDRVSDGQPVVWDLLVQTIEGDPILYRFDGNGSRVTTTEDQTRDQFGSGGVVTRICGSVEDTGLIPQGFGCTESPGAASVLPIGVWPP
jgi:hypothetical protein